MQYKVNKDTMLLFVDLGGISRTSTKEELDSLLSKYKVVITEEDK
jgi:hypothetical protein